MSSAAPLPYRDGPLALLETPRHRTGKVSVLSRKTDPITLEASHMVLSHNAFIRGFNSIYQQAPRITLSDHKDFIGYCIAWHACVEEHHNYEETNLFPAIDRAVGGKDVMAGEVEQHASFHTGMQNFKTYLTGLNNSHESEFKAEKLIQIMDSFSTPLHNHLTFEIESLLALSRFSSAEKPIDLVTIALEAGKKSVTVSFVFDVLPVFLLNLEHVEFEGGMWLDVFPPVSKAAKFVLMRLVPLWQGRRWRFASCAGDGRLKTLSI